METSNPLWHFDTLEALTAILQPDPDVLALVVYGSCATPEFDIWSDIDILILLQEDALENFFPTTDWLEHFSRVYAYEQFQDEFKAVTRACFEDMRRIDIIFTTEAALAQVDIWPRNPMQSGMLTLFSRSTMVDEVVGQFYKPKPLRTYPSDKFEELTRGFRFKSMMCTYKVVRGDLLIALHLALDLVRDTCVVAFLLRDRAEGTDFHKDGSTAGGYIQALQTIASPFSAAGILDIIERANIIFAELTLEWDPNYTTSHQPLLDWIESARGELK
jgi:predicted nucleotidyltransferase